MAKLMCTKCKRLVTTSACPLHKDAKLSDSWKGRMIIIEPKNSEIARIAKISEAGEFALK